MTDTIANEPLDIAEIKRLYPDERVLIGDPIMDETEFHVLSGVPLFHSKDKREVAYLGRAKVIGLESYTLIYTGTFKPMRKWVSLYTRPKTLQKIIFQCWCTTSLHTVCFPITKV